MNRNGSTGNPMDQLKYYYYNNSGGVFDPKVDNPADATNKLAYVGDNPALSVLLDTDIDNQTNTNNYTYDEIGNLKSDDSEDITNISWTVYGKVKEIEKNKWRYRVWV